MKATRKVLVKLFLFLFSIFFILLHLTDIFRDRNVVELSKYYYDFEAETFDVLFFGTSILYSGISPMMLWNEYGIISYNLGAGNESIPMSYYLMKDGIRKDSPDLVVVDCSFVTNQGKRYYLPYVHYAADNMPYFDRYRFEMIFDIVEPKHWEQFLIPFTAYHSFQKEAMDHLMHPSDPYRPLRINFGGRTGKKTYSGSMFVRHDLNPDYKLPDISLTYLLKMKDLCAANKADLLFITLPVIGPNDNCSQEQFDERRNAAYTLENFCEENHLNYINMVDMTEELNLSGADTYDGFHLNISGNEKISHYLGDYIRNHFSVPDQRNNEKYAFMENAYQEFLSWMNNLKTD